MEPCKCKEGSQPYWDYVSCKGCGQVTVSGREWGIAGGKYFKNYAEAVFYKKNGFRPSE